MPRYALNPESNIPIYRQLADQINAEIRSGALRAGQQLPTVREMADQMNLSCGTVKRVYDHLKEMGDVEMTRRRGTFVKEVRQESDNRKAAAMTAINQMMNRLTQLRFSPAEIQIFLSLKMREWGLKWFGVCVAAVAPCEEVAAAIERQISKMGNVRVIACTVEQLREYPYSIDEQADAILASEEDCRLLASALPEPGKLVRVAFAARPQCVGEAARRPGPIAVACRDGEFARIVRACLPEGLRDAVSPCVGDAPIPEDGTVIVPQDWRAVLSEERCGQLEHRGDLLPFAYEIDEGSMIYLEERISRLRDERQLRPSSITY